MACDSLRSTKFVHPFVTSLVVTPAYVMIVTLFAWTLHLHYDVKNGIEKGVGGRIRRAAELSPRSLLDLLPSMANSGDLIYDMDLEPCGGAMFTVWGRTSCPAESDTELVYSGVVGGTDTDSSGGGVDYLCVSRHPQWSLPHATTDDQHHLAYNDIHKQTADKADQKKSTAPPCSKSKQCSKSMVTKATPRSLSRDELMRLLTGNAADRRQMRTTEAPPTQGGDAYLYGTEYEGAQARLDKDNLAADTFIHQDAVCAVCRSKIHTSTVMIPGRRECYAGWTKEYEGFLMSGPVSAPAQHRFACVHRAPEAGYGGHKRDGGAVFYHVRAHCGSLPCPTYIQDKEITCVVCTK